jgi:hypothetical protein
MQAFGSVEAVRRRRVAAAVAHVRPQQGLDDAPRFVVVPTSAGAVEAELALEVFDAVLLSLPATRGQPLRRLQRVWHCGHACDPSRRSYS